MRDAGHAHMGVGRASGKDKAEAAAQAAVSSPLLETTIDGAHGVIISITSSPDIGLDEVEQASSLIAEAAHPEANIIWGVAFDDTLQDEMIITVIATGFGDLAKDDLGLDLPDFSDLDLDTPTRKSADGSDPLFSYAEDEAPKKSGGSFSFDDDDDYFDSIDNIFANRK